MMKGLPAVTIRNLMIIITSAVLVLVIVSAALVITFATPQARTSSGDIVNKPYSMMVDGEEVMLLSSERDGVNALKDVVSIYTPEGTAPKSVRYDRNIEFKEKNIEPFEKLDVALSEKEAVKEIMDCTDEDDPLFTVTVVAEESEDRTIRPKIDFKYKEDMTFFETKVKKKGKEGKKTVTYEVTAENGKVVSKTKKETMVTMEAEDAVIETGYENPPDYLKWDDYDEFTYEVEEEKKDDTVIGEKMIEYGEKHLGAPYKLGGRSYETGIDCGNFVVDVYQKFGIEISRSIAKQGRTGRAVELDKARPGDIVYYGNHVAIYMGDGKIIHARSSRGLTTDKIDYKPWKSIRQIDKRKAADMTDVE